jgi:hypothetical protein
MAKFGICKNCKKELMECNKYFVISAYNGEVGHQQRFETLEEASIVLQKLIGNFETIQFQKRLEVIE